MKWRGSSCSFGYIFHTFLTYTCTEWRHVWSAVCSDKFSDLSDIYMCCLVTDDLDFSIFEMNWWFVSSEHFSDLSSGTYLLCACTYLILVIYDIWHDSDFIAIFFKNRMTSRHLLVLMSQKEFSNLKNTSLWILINMIIYVPPHQFDFDGMYKYTPTSNMYVNNIFVFVSRVSLSLPFKTILIFTNTSMGNP